MTFEGEPRRPGTVTIQTPETFQIDTVRYDIVLNVDSLTEMDPDVARDYWAKFQRR